MGKPSRQTARQRFDREERENVEQRDDALRSRQIRGVAREMRTVFRENLDTYRHHKKLGFWWNEEMPGPSSFERESDRVLIAAAASSDQWEAIERAERAGREVEITREMTVVQGTRLLSARNADPEEESALNFRWYWDPDDPEQGSMHCRKFLDDAIAKAERAIAALDGLCA